MRRRAESGAPPRESGPPEPGGRSRERLRTLPIRRRIGILLVIPLVSLAGLWIFSTAATLSDALERGDFSTVYDEIGVPTGALIQAVQQERAAAALLLAAPGEKNAQAFREKTAATATQLEIFRESSLSPKVQEAVTGAVAQRLEALNGSYDELGTLRSQVEAEQINPLRSIDGYSALIDGSVRLMTTLASVDDVGVYQHSNSLLYLFWAHDFVLRQDVLLSTARTGTVSPAHRAAFARWAGSQEEFFELARAGVEGEISLILRRFAESPAYTSYRSLEDGLVQRGAAPRQTEWKAALAQLTPAWLGTNDQASKVLEKQQLQPIRDEIMLRFYLTGGVGLLAVAVSVAISLLFAGRLARELRGLQHMAQELAHERLPRVVARLRRGEKVDVEAEAPRPPAGRTREVALVADAFATVQRTAVGTAVGEAELRSSINRVFVNLSWRSQSLLHRQLRLLDEMERRASSPEELEALFRLDHLTTRMRRHAEGLVILSGAQTTRAWDRPVSAEDLIRASIAEVEDYTRVEVETTPSADASSVDGDVVTDVIHLLAELIENAASFSPPTTEVTVKADLVANGLVIEVIDRGLGLDAEQLAELNQRLAEPVEFDLADTDRLGLFVVARLAALHEIRVRLQASAYGGTTAIVLVPRSLVANGDQARGQEGHGGKPHPALSGPARRSDAPARYAAPQDPPVRNATPPARHAAVPPPVPPPTPPPSPAGPAAAQEEDRREPGTRRLPRRRRQENLAPQLRDHSSASWDVVAGRDEEAFDDPDPELRRNLMTSLQSGWLQARADDDDMDDGPDETRRRP
ncbi:sensor histidine kinase [Actinocorallia populi]|uniref:sensor histidine kinase n=1 Tax=Actinocorallia populi TaxID=2079200 RepID=UPI000D08B98F|nr:sensor histidine kinase [Actinocorallia populi]